MPTPFSFSAAVWAGLIAGLVFMLAEMLLVATVGDGSAWGPPRMIGAIALGRDVLPPPATFELGVMLVAMMIHFALSIVLGLILGFFISKGGLGLMASIGVGALFGIGVYIVAFYGFTALFPWFAQARTPITLGAHILFGIVLGWAYHSLAVRNYARKAARRDPDL